MQANNQKYVNIFLQSWMSLEEEGGIHLIMTLTKFPIAESRF